MDVKDSLLSTPINPNNFPAKLWRLVNSPCYQSVHWDSRGEGIIIDQQLFESELLCPSEPMKEASELFKTTNFTSFIRQLNLYGFRKVVMDSDGDTCYQYPSGNLGIGASQLHRFYNVNFRKEHPDLLVNLKRLTSTNKAKMAAGLKVNTRPPNRFQRFLSHSLIEQSKSQREKQGVGMMTFEQIQHAVRHENLSQYPYVSPAPHGHIGFPLKEFDHTPMASRTWPNSLSMLQRQLDSPSPFPENRLIFPVLQRFPTDVPYTLQSSANSVHVQQSPPAMSGGMPQYSGYITPTAQYSHAYYPPVLQCCTSPAHMELLNRCSSPAVSSCQHCGYFQNPSPMQSSFPKEFFQTNWPSSDSEVSKTEEENLEAVFQFVDELQSSPQLEIVKLDEEESKVQSPSPPLKNLSSSVTLLSVNNGDSCSQTNVELESLVAVNTDITSCASGSSQSVAYHMPQASNCAYPPYNNHTIVNSNTDTADTALDVRQMELLVSDTSEIKVAKEQDMVQTSGMLKVDKSLDFRILVEVACSQELFTKGGRISRQDMDSSCNV